MLFHCHHIYKNASSRLEDPCQLAQSTDSSPSSGKVVNDPDGYDSIKALVSERQGQVVAGHDPMTFAFGYAN